MKRRGGVVLALATIVAAALASTAGAGSSSVATTQAINCKNTVKLALITPLTGGGGFIGQEQLAWAKYGVKTLAKKYGLKVQLAAGGHTGREGHGEAVVVAQKFISDPNVLVAIGPATSGGVAVGERGAHRGGHRADLAVGDADVADEGREQGGDERLLPRRAR